MNIQFSPKESDLLDFREFCLTQTDEGRIISRLARLSFTLMILVGSLLCGLLSPKYKIWVAAWSFVLANVVDMKFRFSQKWIDRYLDVDVSKIEGSTFTLMVEPGAVRLQHNGQIVGSDLRGATVQEFKGILVLHQKVLVLIPTSAFKDETTKAEFLKAI
ncbi:MAG: hypothetical protein ABSG04_06390 [Verrucomicrobiota bacterium]